MSIALNIELEDELKRQAVAAYPMECCGLLFANEGENAEVSACIPLENNAEEERAKGYYQIDPLELFRMEKEQRESGRSLVGVYHSHPDRIAIPSVSDERGMIPGMIYLILSASSKRCMDIRAWSKEDVTSECREQRVNRG